MATASKRTFTADNGSIFTLRSAALNDAEVILDFMRLAAKESGQFFLTNLEEFNRITLEEETQFIEKHLTNPCALLLIAEIENQVVGVLNICNGHRQRNSHTSVFGIAIAKNYHGQGLGQEMMKTMIEWARSTGVIEKIDLSVDTHNPRAIALYERFGFKTEGTQFKQTKHAPGVYTDTLLMSLWL